MFDQLLISIDHPILKNHRAYGQSLLPGLAYIDIVYQFFREQGFDYAELELRNLIMFNPLIVGNDYKVMLSIQCSEINSRQWRIRLEGQKEHNGIVDPKKTHLLDAEMHRVDPIAFHETLDVDQVKQSAKKTFILDQAYELFRRGELLITGFFKAEGKIYEGETATLVDASLGQEALPSAEDFMFHPTLIDGSGIGSGFLFSSLIKDKLFLPLSYESFRASALLQKRCLTRVQTSSVRHKKEVIYLTMDFFDETGKKVAELKNLIIKLIREAGSINPNRKEIPQPTTRSKSIKPSATRLNKSVDEPNAVGAASTGEAESFLRQLLADRLKKPAAQIQTRIGYYEMGLDSPGLIELVKEIESGMGIILPPTLMFEYPTLAELSAYLTENYASQVGNLGTVKQGGGRLTADSRVPATPSVAHASIPEFAMQDPIRRSTPASSSAATSPAIEDEIAIIGVSGRYPQARNIEEFWENFRESKDCVTEIPEERWDYRKHYDPEKNKAGKCYGKWGGFIDDVDRFDASFFNIHHEEAVLMDPESRLVLQTVWHVIEDAGYTRDSLEKEQVGVYFGSIYGDYHLLGLEEALKGNVLPVVSSHGAMVNRVSYHFGFDGPSVACDTLCSSSLTAIHMACESIRRGECGLAVAGGVNLTIHWSKYILLSNLGLMSSGAKHRSYGEGGDGYVPAEGVGAVLLKPVTAAIRDGDHIYAVIKGSSLKSAGKRAGFMVPNPQGQTNVILDTLQKFQIDPRTISYVEGFALGSALGDPIEILGLTKAFSAYTEDKQYCPIGAGKTNTGHMEAASGVSAVTKVLLQMRHKKLVPSLNSEKLNPAIHFEETPFYVQHKFEDWKQPVIRENGEEKKYPRRAGVTAYGAGGSYLFLILEEYENPTAAPVDQKGTPRIIVLSAKNKERLAEYVKELILFLERKEEHEISLTDLAYTLQVGREAMEERLAVIVSSVQELIEKLSLYDRGKYDVENAYSGTGENEREEPLLEGRAGQELFQGILRNEELAKLAQMWVSGAVIDWKLLYSEQMARRISLPTYPFARERYWVSSSTDQICNSA